MNIKRRRKANWGNRKNKNYDDTYINNLNQRLYDTNTDSRYCKSCEKILPIDNFELRYYQITKETKNLPPDKQCRRPVYYATCIECRQEGGEN